MNYILLPTYLWDGISERPESGICLLVEGEKIVRKGTLQQCLSQAPDAVVIRGDYLVLPGFIDAHDHGRGISPTGFGVPDAPLEMWVQDLWKIPAVNHDTATYFDGLRLLSSGVTTVLHSHNPNNFNRLYEEVVSAARGYLDAGIRCILCPLYLDQNKGVYAHREEFISSLPEEIGKAFRAGIHDKIFDVDTYLALMDSLRDTFCREISDGLVELQLHPNGGQWCSDDALLRMKEYALAHGMKIHMHLLETRYQAIYAQKEWGCSFIEHYEKIGFLGPWLSCAHMIWLSDTDQKLLRQYDVLPINNPSSNIRLRSGVFPLRELIEKEIPVALGLDGCAFDDDQDYLREMRTAFYNIERVGAGSVIENIVPLKMATVWGSRITDGRLSPGTLTEGVDADFVCISMKELRRPYADDFADVIDLLLHRGRREVVQMTYVKGKKIYDKEESQGRLREAEAALTDEIRKLRQTTPCKEILWKKELLSRIEDFYKGWETEYENYSDCTNCTEKKIHI
ncbi:MAG: amidohydrolase family protein [Oscillospiraceae bacterium]|nr:amidohydrolase family protein [Oscillospiraceae bacterium]